MNRVYIEDIDKRTIIEVDKDKKISGSIYYSDGRIEPITVKTFDIFKSFILSKNNKILPNEGEYKVILDNETGFKHYFLNGEENFLMLFLNNGEDGITSKVENVLLEGNGWQKKVNLSMKQRIYRIGRSVISGTSKALMVTFLAFLVTNSLMIVNHSEYTENNNPFPFASYLIEELRDKSLRTEDLIDYIYSKDSISTEDRDFLATKDYFDDLIPYININECIREMYLEKFKNIEIESYDNTNTNNSGYYSYGKPGTLHIAEKYIGTDLYYDILSHEDIHRCQANCGYNLLSEACAEIESFEYRNQPSDSYYEEVCLTKKLMEIIGSEPVFEYVHTGYFGKIEEAVKPYLTSQEYASFLYDLWQYDVSSSKYEKEEVKAKHQDLDTLLTRLYERKYNSSIDEDPVIPYIGSVRLVRYYFNHRKMEKEGSYVTVYTHYDREFSLEEAVEMGFIYIQKVDKNGYCSDITYDDYINEKENEDEKIVFTSDTNYSFNITCDNEGNYKIIIHNFYREETIDLPQVDDKIKELEDKRVNKT